MDFLKKAFNRLSTKVDGDELPEIESQADQPEDEQKLIAYIKGKITDVRNSGSRVSNEGVWMTNYAYFMGYDSVYYDTSTRQYRVSGRASSFLKRNRIHVNKILPTVQRRQARLCKNEPKFEVRPDDATQEAKDKARLEQNLADVLWRNLRIQEKRLRMAVGVQNCGHYFMGVYWDPTKGRLLGTEEVDGNQVTVNEGETRVDLIHPLEMFVDPLAVVLDDAQWAIRAKVRKLDYFRNQYPRGHLVKEEDAWLLSIQYEQRIQSLTGQGPAQTGIQQNMKNAAIEIAYYERPSGKHPRGRLVILASDILLHDGELPVGDFPFVKFDDIVVDGKFYSEAIVTHLRPIQDQYNRVITKRAEWTNRLAAGKILAAKGAGIQQEALTDQSGEVVYYNHVANTSPPTQMNVPVMPQYVYTEEDRLNNMFYDIAGEGEISRGQLPAAGVPAIGMQLLLEQDETRIGIITEQWEHAFAKLMQIVLQYEEKFVTNERLLKVADPNGQYVVKKYSGSDLKSAHDVIVVRGSLAPASKAVNRQDIINLYSNGLLGEPSDPSVRAKVLQWIEFGDISGAWQDQALDMSQIKKHIEMIENEIMPQVYEADNHVLAYQELNRFRKSDKFETMSAVSQGMLLQTMEDHLKFIQKLTAPSFGMPPNASHQVETDTEALMAQQEQAEAAMVMDQEPEQNMGEF